MNRNMRIGAIVMTLISFTSSMACKSACADEETKGSGDAAPTVSFKLTPSYYQQSDGNDATDANLRASSGPHTGWLGYYRDHNEFQQTRAGYEFTQDAGPAQIVWSAQAASRGFLGGSITAQIGDPVYAIVGLGRTNLRPYYNLNFDPNDMITLGAGTKLIANTDLSITHIWDDRLGTRQHVTHVYLHRTMPGGERFSIDASYKRGLDSDNVYVTGYALTLTYAWKKYFVRLARDQYANFDTTTQNRLSLGTIF